MSVDLDLAVLTVTLATLEKVEKLLDEAATAVRERVAAGLPTNAVRLNPRVVDVINACERISRMTRPT